MKPEKVEEPPDTIEPEGTLITLHPEKEEELLSTEEAWLPNVQIGETKLPSWVLPVAAVAALAVVFALFAIAGAAVMKTAPAGAA